MKEFNYEKAKAGAPVCTRYGKKARIVCFNVKSEDERLNILALVETDNGYERAVLYDNNGRTYFRQTPGVLARYQECDLMMAGIKREGWVNIFGKKGLNSCGGFIYPSIERAKEDGEQCEEYITTIHIEWEE